VNVLSFVLLAHFVAELWAIFTFDLKTPPLNLSRGTFHSYFYFCNFLFLFTNR